MSRGERCFCIWLTVVAVLVLVSPVAGAEAPGSDIADALARLDAIFELEKLSKALWPGWDISDVPFALYGPDAACYLVHHPKPPSTFSRVPERLPIRTVHRAPAAAGVAPETGELGGVPTAFIPWSDFSDELVPSAFREGLRAHLRERCRARCEPISLIEGYPIDPRNLALSDIECELLAQAIAAPDDSLEQRTLEFVSVRSLRQIGLRGRAAEYERWLEFIDGLPVYVAERCRREGAEYAKKKAAELLEGRFGTPSRAGVCRADSVDLDWYRRDRFRCTGAGVCELLDRFHPGWQKEASDRCLGPYEILWQLTRTEFPRASEVLGHWDFQHRLAERTEFVDGTKSEAEKLFERIVEGDEPRITVNTRLLASTSVSYDPENIDTVDEHRIVHRRVIKIEYSGGTRVHVMGRPVATVVGDGEFDIRELIMAAPDEYTVTVGGEPLVLEKGVHQVDQPLSVVGQGLLIEARSGVIIVGEGRVTFVLHM